MEIARLVLQYLQMVLSWPVITGALALYFLYSYRSPFSEFLRRITKGQGFGISLEATPVEQRKEIKEGDVLQLDTPLAQAVKDETRSDLKGDPTIPSQAQVLIDYIKQDPDTAVRELGQIYNALRFERAYNLIYGSQLELLEHLLSKRVDGENYVNLHSFYERFLDQLETTSRDSKYQYADYIGFLQDAGFVERADKSNEVRFRITPFGIDFLSYIRIQYPSYKYKAF
ncbi:MAG: hypothetical protein ACREBD_28845 [Blastocatellia bacterium]